MHGGAGTAIISGSSNIGTFYCDGVSFLSAKELLVDNVSCNNSGDNDIFVSPGEFLFGYIGGHGNIYYNNSDIEADINIFGEGNVIYNEF